MTPVGAATPALALARAYIDTLLAYSAEDAIAIPRLAADHIADLIAAAAAPVEAWREQQNPNLLAGRLEAIRRELDRNFMMAGFSLPVLARRMGVSSRYVQTLLAEEATSFTDEVANRRLARAHDMLSSSRYLHMNVMDIANQCGFSTVSHFHRVFRRHFAATPGEVRGGAAKPVCR